ncbi:MAG: cation acetate symporter [Gemmatimonadaceae bacterium]
MTTFVLAAGVKALPLAIFAVVLAGTLGITYWAAKRTSTATEFWAAGRGVTGVQNGWAIAGDYMSASSFLGFAGLVFLFGVDAFVSLMAALVAFLPVLLFLAERMRNSGKYTLADVLSFRLSERPARMAAATGTLAVVLVYLVAQMVGAGVLIQALIGISFTPAVIIVGAFMLAYVIFGGMLATTWVQIVKAVLLLGGAFLLAILVLARFGMNPARLFAAAAERYGSAVLAPGKLVSNPFDAISLGMALMFGTAGLPHILMRFYTVPDARAARTSVFYATGLIGFFYLLTFILGFGAMVLVGPETITSVDKGGNMAAPLLAELLGGRPLLGFIAAVAFATILAVVAGLTLSGAAALSHDLWVSVVKKGDADAGEQLRVARMATVALGIVAVLLGITFKGQNVAYMVSLAFAIAASGNFPALVLSIFWRRCTTAGAVASMVVGTFVTLLLIWLSPTIQVDILKHASASFPLRNPALVTIPLSFLVGAVVSLLTQEAGAAERFAGVARRMHMGAAGD